ncbi:MAG TPA: cbb3-type cytochrome c oxidase subunit I, partial [Gaiellaceae bacterium]|nr:cbb3-type cytochrome c oxidase subunit I [Gaiellaceae bacterium]
VGGILGVTFLSSYVWTHHMFVVVSQSREIPFMTTTELISIPTSLMYMCAIGTLWKARAQMKTPLLLVLFSMLNFLIGGISGTFLADVPVNYYVHDTFFVVAHFHYTILGGMVFAWVAAMYWWLPKWSGRTYDERIGKLLSWWTFVFFNWTFFSMFLVGLNGMNRRVATYPQYLGTENFWISVPAWFLGAGFIAHAVYLAYVWRRGERVAENPWESHTLDWQIPSPPPLEDFEREPIVIGDFYRYGEPGPEPELLPVPGIEEVPPPQRAPAAPAGGSE